MRARATHEVYGPMRRWVESLAHRHVHERRRSEAGRLRLAYPLGRTKRRAGRPTRQQEFEEACVRALNEDQFHLLEQLTSSEAPCWWRRGDPIWVDEERRVAEANALDGKGSGDSVQAEGDAESGAEGPKELAADGVAVPAAALADAFKAEPQAAPTVSGDVTSSWHCALSTAAGHRSSFGWARSGEVLM